MVRIVKTYGEFINEGRLTRPEFMQQIYKEIIKLFNLKFVKKYTFFDKFSEKEDDDDSDDSMILNTFRDGNGKFFAFDDSGYLSMNNFIMLYHNSIDIKKILNLRIQLKDEMKNYVITFTEGASDPMTLKRWRMNDKSKYISYEEINDLGHPKRPLDLEHLLWNQCNKNLEDYVRHGVWLHIENSEPDKPILDLKKIKGLNVAQELMSYGFDIEQILPGEERTSVYPHILRLTLPVDEVDVTHCNIQFKHPYVFKYDIREDGYVDTYYGDRNFGSNLEKSMFQRDTYIGLREFRSILELILNDFLERMKGSFASEHIYDKKRPKDEIQSMHVRREIDKTLNDLW